MNATEEEEDVDLIYSVTLCYPLLRGLLAPSISVLISVQDTKD